LINTTVTQQTLNSKNNYYTTSSNSSNNNSNNNEFSAKTSSSTQTLFSSYWVALLCVQRKTLASLFSNNRGRVLLAFLSLKFDLQLFNKGTFFFCKN